MRVPADAEPGDMIRNTATVTSDVQDDPDPDNNTDTAEHPIPDNPPPPPPPPPPGPTPPPPPGGYPSAPSRFLAYTGDHIAQVALLAGLVLAAGLVLIVVRRRRNGGEAAQ